VPCAPAVCYEFRENLELATIDGFEVENNRPDVVGLFRPRSVDSSCVPGPQFELKPLPGGPGGSETSQGFSSTWPSDGRGELQDKRGDAGNAGLGVGDRNQSSPGVSVKVRIHLGQVTRWARIGDRVTFLHSWDLGERSPIPLSHPFGHPIDD